MSVIVEVSARKFGIPFECACCADDNPEGELTASYTRRTGKRVIRETTRGLAFPYCRPCLAHVRAWESSATLAIWIVVAGVALGVVAGSASGEDAGVGVCFGSFLLAPLALWSRRRAARRRCRPSCAVAAASVQHRGWSGTVHSLRFASARYAAAFARSNAHNLVNVSPELRRLLQQPMAAPARAVEPAATSAPSAPAGAAPSTHELVLGWISRIEGYKGAVARRNALERALAELQDPGARGQVLVAASRIEVAAVLDKVDALASPAARRRHLQRAIADLRADNVPDELQAEALQRLEERLRAIA